jgi:glycosyltransferase A (GT-A) superfamily protein (DUF2064 family)
VPPIFDGVAWGTTRVWQQTVERLHAARLRWHELPGWFDVDDEDGLDALLVRLQDLRQRDSELARLDDRLQALLSDGRAV